jgi:hypothetical protein
MAFVEDLSSYFHDAPVYPRNGSLFAQGFFDNAYAEAFGIISGNDPVFRCLSSVGMARGDTLLIDGVTYTVTHIESDAGIDLCRLESA